MKLSEKKNLPIHMKTKSKSTYNSNHFHLFDFSLISKKPKISHIIIYYDYYINFIIIILNIYSLHFNTK